MIKTIDITIGNLKFNGAYCKDPVVTYVGSANLSLKCKDDAQQIYTVQTLDDGPDAGLPQCLTFVVSCGECSECESKVVERCICSTIADCPPCHDCVNGICVPKCKDGEQCVDGTCTNCKDDDDCPCNQICTTTGCKCASGLVLNPLNGCCDACGPNKPCGPCLDCLDINGVKTCVPRSCPNGVCDPSIDDCVQCLVDQDCINSPTNCNTCKSDNTCGPGPNQYWNGVSCIDVDGKKCDEDFECGQCENCFNHVCTKKACTPGEVLDTLTCTCRTACNCDEPGGCPQDSQYCNPVPGLTPCACFDCTGTCDENNPTCGPSPFCFCSNGRCISNYCVNTNCNSGLDCGPNCGCVDGKCVPCESLSCTTSECAEASGCKCTGLVCVGDDCNNTPCNNLLDCAEGCTCYESDCIGCSNFSCTDGSCDARPGCKCVNGKCVNDPDARECTDDLTITEQADCSLLGTLMMDECCQCPVIIASIAVQRKTGTSTTNTLDLAFDMRKRISTTDSYTIATQPLLTDTTNDNIALNDWPLTGSFKLLVVEIGTYYPPNGGASEGWTNVALDRSVSPAGSSARQIISGVTVRKIGSEFAYEGGTVKVTSVHITLRQKGVLANDANNCQYVNLSGGVNTSSIIYNNESQLPTADGTFHDYDGSEAKSTSCMKPLFKWYKNGEVIRKKYITASAQGTYTDILDPSDYELRSCNTYSLNVDCSCVNTASKNVVFKNLEWTVTPIDCGAGFTLDSFSSCDGNKDKTFYIKYLNKRFEFKYPDEIPTGANAIFKSDNKECIGQIEVGIVCDGQDVPFEEDSKYIQCQDYTQPIVTSGCSSDGTKQQIVFPKQIKDSGGNGYNITQLIVTNTATGIPTPYNSTLFKTNSAGNYYIEVTPATYSIEFKIQIGTSNCTVKYDMEIGKADCCAAQNDSRWSTGGPVSTEATFPFNPGEFFNSGKTSVEVVDGLTSRGLLTSDMTKAQVTAITAGGYDALIERFNDNVNCQKELIRFEDIDPGDIDMYATPTGSVNAFVNTIPPFDQSVQQSSLSVTSQNATGLVSVNPSGGTNGWALSGLEPGVTYDVELTTPDYVKQITYTHPECNYSVSLSLNAQCDTITLNMPANLACTCPVRNGSISARATAVANGFMTVDIGYIINQTDPTINMTDIDFKYNYDGTDYDVPGCTGNAWACTGSVQLPLPVGQQCLSNAVLSLQFAEAVSGSGIPATLLPTLNGVPMADLDNSSVSISINGSLLKAFTYTFTSGLTYNITVTLIQNNISYSATISWTALGANGFTAGATTPLTLTNFCTASNGDYNLVVKVANAAFNDNCTYDERVMTVSASSLVDIVGGTAYPAVSISEKTGFLPLNVLSRHKKVTWYEKTPGQSGIGSVILTEWVAGTVSLNNSYYTQGNSYTAKVECSICSKTTNTLPYCCPPDVTLSNTTDKCIKESITVTLDGSAGTYDVYAGYLATTTEPPVATGQMTIVTTGTPVSQEFIFNSTLAGHRQYNVKVEGGDSCSVVESFMTPEITLVDMVQECVERGVSAEYALVLTVRSANGQTIYSSALGEYELTLTSNPAGAVWDSANGKLTGINGSTYENQDIVFEVTIKKAGDIALDCTREITHTITNDCQTSPVDCPDNLYPANGDANIGVNIGSLDWDSVTGAVSYKVTLTDEVLGSDVFTDESVTTPYIVLGSGGVDVLPLKYNNEYSFTVISVTGGGGESTNCAVNSFTTVAAPACNGTVTGWGTFNTTSYYSEWISNTPSLNDVYDLASGPNSANWDVTDPFIATATAKARVLYTSTTNPNIEIHDEQDFNIPVKVASLHNFLDYNQSNNAAVNSIVKLEFYRHVIGSYGSLSITPSVNSYYSSVVNDGVCTACKPFDPTPITSNTNSNPVGFANALGQTIINGFYQEHTLVYGQDYQFYIQSTASGTGYNHLLIFTTKDLSSAPDGVNAVYNLKQIEYSFVGGGLTGGFKSWVPVLRKHVYGNSQINTGLTQTFRIAESVDVLNHNIGWSTINDICDTSNSEMRVVLTSNPKVADFTVIENDLVVYTNESTPIDLSCTTIQLNGQANSCDPNTNTTVTIYDGGTVLASNTATSASVSVTANYSVPSSVDTSQPGWQNELGPFTVGVTGCCAENDPENEVITISNDL